MRWSGSASSRGLPVSVSTAVFYYHARCDDGSVVSGSMIADSKVDAVKRLRLRRLFVTSIEDAKGVRGRAGALLAAVAMPRAARIAFMRTLATLVGSSTSLQRALCVAIEQCADRRFKESLQAVASDVDGGALLSEAFARRPDEFPEVVVAMVAAGELGGVLDQVLERCAELLEQRDSLNRQLAAALAYPAFVLVTSMAILGFLLVFTVPGFVAILAQLHATIPLPTRILIWASNALRSPSTLTSFIAGAAATGALAVSVHGTRAARWMDRRLLDIPVAGALRRQGNVAAFARTTGTLLQCGVPIGSALDAACGVMTSQAYRQAVRDAKSMLEEGRPLSAGLARGGLFGTLCVHMAAVGEESGALDSVLLRLAKHVEREVELKLRGLTAIVEPALILVMGAAVGGVVGSVLIPMYAAIGSVH